MLILTVSSTNAWTCFAIGCTLNATLCLLAKKHSTAEMHEYRTVVYYFSVTNICSLLLIVITQPIVFTGNNGCVYIYLGGIASQLPTPTQRSVVLSCATMFFLAILASSSLQFLDRYLVICRSNTRKCCRYLLLALGQNFFVGICVLLCLATTPGEDSRFQQTLPRWQQFFTGPETDGMTVAAIAEMQYSGTRMIFTVMVVALAVCNLLVVWCYLKIRAFVRGNLLTSEVTVNNRNQQRDFIRQITRNLLLQALLPLFVISVFGANLLYFLSFQSTSSSSILGLQMLSFGVFYWLSVINPLITILTIHNYKSGLLQLFIRKKPNSVAAVNVLGSSSHQQKTLPPTGMIHQRTHSAAVVGKRAHQISQNAPVE